VPSRVTKGRTKGVRSGILSRLCGLDACGRLAVDVLRAERTEGAVLVHQAICGVDVLHVAHHAKPGMVLDPVLRIEPGDGLGHEARDIVALLVEVDEVLARELSDPDVHVVGSVPESDVGREVVNGGTVPVKAHEVNAAVRAGTDEGVRPVDAVGVGRGRSRTETVSLGLQRFHVLPP